MAAEIHPITTREAWLALRHKDVTASAAPALLGIHPFITAYALAMEKREKEAPAPLEETGALRRGNRLEGLVRDEVAAMRAEWDVKPGLVYLRDPEARLGATPDTIVQCPKRGLGTVQIKTAAEPIFRKKWMVDGAVEVPAWIAVQANIEADLLGADWAAVAVLSVGFGWDVHVIEIPVHKPLMARIREEVAKFWAILDAGRMPDPDYARDGALISQIYAQAAPGKTIDLSLDNRIQSLLADRVRLKAEIKERDALLDQVDAEIRDKLGDAERAIVPGWKLSHTTVNRRGYTVEAKSYRQLRAIPVSEAAE